MGRSRKMFGTGTGVGRTTNDRAQQRVIAEQCLALVRIGYAIKNMTAKGHSMGEAYQATSRRCGEYIASDCTECNALCAVAFYRTTTVYVPDREAPREEIVNLREAPPCSYREHGTRPREGSAGQRSSQRSSEVLQ